jgi:NAD(P)-dependent dehydrogenase (short-subunit alcohol dehydrogenase family)
MMKERIVVVTGGAKGIGRSIALAFANLGDLVILVDVDLIRGQRLEQELKLMNLKSCFYPCDLKNIKQIDDLIDMIRVRFGHFDILINNTGLSCFKPLGQMTIEDYDQVLAVNLKAPFYLSQQFYVLNKGCHYGRIINIASTRAFMSEPHSEAYASSKGGIISLTHALALSLSSEKITVNCISPGWIHTGHDEELREVDHLQHPSGRVGKPEDIAKMCVFLCEEEQDFINGENMIIDGGMTKKMMYVED